MTDQSTLAEEQGRSCSPDLDQISNELDNIRILGDVCEQRRRLHQVLRKLDDFRNATESMRVRGSHWPLSDNDRTRLSVLRSVAEKLEENLPFVADLEDNEPETNEVVGDIDDMLANLDIDGGSSDRGGQRTALNDDEVPLAREMGSVPGEVNVIPGRRYRRVIRSSVGGASKPRYDTAVRPGRRGPKDEADGTTFVQTPMQGQSLSPDKEEDSSLEQHRYRRHAPQPHLDVEIPISKDEIAAAVAPRKDSLGDRGSSGSTHAQRYGAEPSDSESDESITSPDALPGGNPASFG